MLIYGAHGLDHSPFIDDWWAGMVFDQVNGLLGPKVSLETAYEQATLRALEASNRVNMRTMNPMMLQYLPDDPKWLDQIAFYGLGGKLVKVNKCPPILEKMKVLGLGEALADTELERCE